VGPQDPQGLRGAAAAVSARNLHGLSTGDFVPALEQFLGSTAGLSSATITRLTAQWTEDHKAFQARDLSECDFVYVWADGVHLKVRLEEAKDCVLVLVGVRADGSKELIAMDSGHRESGESWANLLRDAERRGMRAPVLAVGDGALGFWKALREGCGCLMTPRSAPRGATWCGGARSAPGTRR
jgi:transposase-like protein